MSVKTRHIICLFLTAAIWGFAFVFQKTGGDSMGSFTFNMLRNVLGALTVIPVVIKTYGSLKPDKETLKGGIICGFFLGIASCIQQVGIELTTPGKAGFLTSIYMVIVAMSGFLFKRKTERTTWIGVVVAVIGLYYLCIPKGESFSLTLGEILCITSAFLYACQIISIDMFIDRVEGIKMSFIQFITAAVVSFVLVLITGEQVTISGIMGGLGPLLYVGIMSTGVAFTLQIVGQQGVDPAIASLIMSLESLFSVIGEWLILGLLLSGRELLGCLFMGIAVLITQLPALMPIIKRKLGINGN
ncbi:MAG: DMT family transporter [Eubacteriales bacterium]|nr:DMT family transporter [Eubacteriales bacterium]